ncbi:hypothetical protein [Methanobrevibacter oralis]|nr:hypothetical protein [Methanobrevibacter oralis]
MIVLLFIVTCGFRLEAATEDVNRANTITIIIMILDLIIIPLL